VAIVGILKMPEIAASDEKDFSRLDSVKRIFEVHEQHAENHVNCDPLMTYQTHETNQNLWYL
jgi:hypothetical protein